MVDVRCTCDKYRLWQTAVRSISRLKWAKGPFNRMFLCIAAMSGKQINCYKGLTNPTTPFLSKLSHAATHYSYFTIYIHRNMNVDSPFLFLSLLLPLCLPFSLSLSLSFSIIFPPSHSLCISSFSKATILPLTVLSAIAYSPPSLNHQFSPLRCDKPDKRIFPKGTYKNKLRQEGHYFQFIPSFTRTKRLPNIASLRWS